MKANRKNLLRYLPLVLWLLMLAANVVNICQNCGGLIVFAPRQIALDFAQSFATSRMQAI